MPTATALSVAGLRRAYPPGRDGRASRRRLPTRRSSPDVMAEARSGRRHRGDHGGRHRGVVAVVRGRGQRAPGRLRGGGRASDRDRRARRRRLRRAGASWRATPGWSRSARPGWTTTGTGPSRPSSRTHFRRHIELAKAVGKPLMIHDRDAHADVLRILREEGAPEQVVFHAFSGDAAMARECVAAGYVLSFPGVDHVPNAPALRAAAAAVPIEQMLVETDAPFLTPHPFRGRPNAPRLLPLTVRAWPRRSVPTSTSCAPRSGRTARGCSASRPAEPGPGGLSPTGGPAHIYACNSMPSAYRPVFKAVVIMPQALAASLDRAPATWACRTCEIRSPCPTRPAGRRTGVAQVCVLAAPSRAVLRGRVCPPG